MRYHWLDDTRRTTEAYLLILATLIACLVFSGCQGPDPVQVEAQRAEYEAIAPLYTTYVEEDSAITQEVKDRRLRTVRTWDLRIQSLEEAMQQR